jgi:hypothetical protein
MDYETLDALRTDALGAAREIEDPFTKSLHLSNLGQFDEAADTARGIESPERRSTALQTVFERARRS